MAERLTIPEAEALLTAALAASNTSDANARSVARALVAAEVDGQKGHGFSRLLAYAAQARSGKVDGHAVPLLTQTAAALLTIDAGHGFAYPALDTAAEALPPLAAQTGIAAATIFRSHHCGQLGRQVERLAEAGMIALMVANAPKAMAPWGGNAPLFGTNPIGFAAPCADAPPLVIDLSLSKVARGKVMAAAQAGEAIPEGWALDPDGNPTTDPNAGLKGTMVPAGGAKGAALALMVEILSASLTGANHSYQTTSFFDADGAPPGVGQTIIAIDPKRANPGFPGRLTELVAEIEGQARLPGSRRHALRDHAAKEGLAIRPELLSQIRAMAAKT